MINRNIIAIVFFIVGNLFSRDWVEVNSPSPSEPAVVVLSNTQEAVKLSFELSG